VSTPCDKAARKPLEASWEVNASNVEGAPQAAPEPANIVAAHRTATLRHRHKGSVFMIAARVCDDPGNRTLSSTLARRLLPASGTLIAVPPQGTSQQCPECVCVSVANRLTQARFRCVECLHEDNADVVGRKTFWRGTPRCSLWRGRQSLREQRSLVEQEPAEATEREATHA